MADGRSGGHLTRPVAAQEPAMRISQATPLLGPLQTIAGACAHADAATTGPAAHAAASHGAASPQGAATLPSVSLDHRVATKVAVATDELRRAVEAQQKQMRELREALDRQGADGSLWSWFGAWMVGADGGVAELHSMVAADHLLSPRLQSRLIDRQQDTPLTGIVSRGTHETIDDDLRRRLA
jgi:hypothetical protein